MKRLVAFIGSPRKESSSKFLLDLFLSSFEGVKDFFEVYTLEIYPCNACGSCYETGVCVIRDDMEKIYASLEVADYVVVSSPVYFYGPPSPLKSVIDRSQVFWARKYLKKERLKNKKGALITVGATKGENLFLPFYYITKVWFNSMNVSFDVHVKIGGVEELRDLEMRGDLLREVESEGGSFFS